MSIFLSQKFSNLFLNSTRLQSNTLPKCFLHVSAVNQFSLTDNRQGEPMKAKKRIDPQVLLARENRKRKRIEKQIKSMEKLGRKLKPVEETEPDRALVKEAE